MRRTTTSRPNDRPESTTSGSIMSQVASRGGGSSRGNSGSNGESSGGQRGAGGQGRSALISDLVSQLKRGDITKTELFSRLQQLQRPASAIAGSTAGDRTGVSASVTYGGGAAPVNLREGNVTAAVHQVTTGSLVATASSGDISVGAAGVAAAGSAGVFSAYDRQVGWCLCPYNATSPTVLLVCLTGLLRTGSSLR